MSAGLRTQPIHAQCRDRPRAGGGKQASAQGPTAGRHYLWHCRCARYVSGLYLVCYGMCIKTPILIIILTREAKHLRVG